MVYTKNVARKTGTLRDETSLLQSRIKTSEKLINLEDNAKTYHNGIIEVSFFQKYKAGKREKK